MPVVLPFHLPSNPDSGHVRKNWKRRWFVLTSRSLTYYDGPNEQRQRGSVELRGTTDAGKDATGGENAWHIAAPGRRFAMKADTEQDMMKWIEAVRNVAKRINAAVASPAAGGGDRVGMREAVEH